MTRPLVVTGKVRCPHCRKGFIDKVVNSRPHVFPEKSAAFAGEHVIKRTRQCLNCGSREFTYEITETALAVIEKSVVKQVLDRIVNIVRASYD